MAREGAGRIFEVGLFSRDYGIYIYIRPVTGVEDSDHIHVYIIQVYIIRVYISSERTQVPTQGSAENVLLRSDSKKKNALDHQNITISAAWYIHIFS